MAYYGAGFYSDEIGEYHYEYDHVVPYSDAEYSYEPKLIDYCPADYGVYSCSDFDEQPAFVHPYPPHAYESSYSHPEMNYSVFSLSQPKLITYEPIPCDIGYAVSQTQYSISYSTKISEFDEPEFEEYDPTPYDGGYDITLTYGKPLPPSDKTCYPRSTPESSGLPSKDISSGIIPVPTPKIGDAGDLETPLGGDGKVNVGDSDNPANSIVKVDETEIGNENEESGEIGDMLSIVKVSSDGSDIEEPIESEQDEDRQVEYTFSSYSDYGYDYPWSGYGYGNGKQVREGPPCEYNPDTVDLCESIFGHWPCLARMQQRSNGVKEDVSNGRRNNNNPWETTADYIFGDPFGKDGGRYDGGGSSYGSENFYQQQSSIVTEGCYVENSWIHQFNIF